MTTPTTNPEQTEGRTWVNGALAQLKREAARSADTHLLHVELPAYPGYRLLFQGRVGASRRAA